MPLFKLLRPLLCPSLSLIPISSKKTNQNIRRHKPTRKTHKERYNKRPASDCDREDERLVDRERIRSQHALELVRGHDAP